MDALKNSEYTTFVLARKVRKYSVVPTRSNADNSETSPELEKEVGVVVLPVDYSDHEFVAQLLDKHKIDTVISTISNYDNVGSAEISLIKAADLAKTTRRFIPSIWSGFDYTDELDSLSNLNTLY